MLYSVTEKGQTMKTVESQFVKTFEVTDPDTHLPVEVEIRKLESGEMVGFDGAYLHAVDDGDNPNNPYDEGKVNVSSDEGNEARQRNKS